MRATGGSVGDRDRAAVPTGRHPARCVCETWPMARLRLFASVREAAGRARDEVPGATVDEVLRSAGARYGDDFVHVLETCRVWVNGVAAGPSEPVGDDDEVALLPPVSGGC